MSRRSDLDLSDDQRFALMKLRRNVADLQLGEKHDDCFLLRWLGARNFNPKAAEEMLRTSMKWREEWSINKDDGWKAPQTLVDYMPSGISGYDKEGSPVIVLPFAGFDVCGLLKAAPPKDMVRFLAERLDEYLEIARQSSLKHGPKASQMRCIVDLTDFNLRQFTWRPEMEFKCINKNCITTTKKNFVQAQPGVCNYYQISYKPQLQVCHDCLEKSILYYNKIGNLFKNEQCIFDAEHPNRKLCITINDDEDIDTNNTSVPNKSLQERQIAAFTKTAINNTRPLIDKQYKKCQNYLESTHQRLAAKKKTIDDLVQQANKEMNSFRSLLLTLNKPRYVFEEECTNNGENETDNPLNIYNNKDVVPDSPGFGIPTRQTLKVGDKIYAMKYSLLQPWFEAIIQTVVSNKFFNVKFCDTGEEKYLVYTNLAYTNPSDTQYLTGSRVIAKFQDVDIQKTDNFYVGIVAESPSQKNNFRYLIFFDDGYAQYVDHKGVRLVCYQSTDVSDDVHENSKEFIKDYLKEYPNRQMVKCIKKQFIRAELNNKWELARVMTVDASLVQLKFLDIKHTEWLYRGSNRLGPLQIKINKNKQGERIRNKALNVIKTLNKPYIELEYSETTIDSSISEENNCIIYNVDPTDSNTSLEQPEGQLNHGLVVDINIPAECPKPWLYCPHQCNHFCTMWTQYDVTKTKHMNPLSIPLHFGYERHSIKNEDSKSLIAYKTPCGRLKYNKTEMYNYLKVTTYNENQMTIDLFDFDPEINPLAEYKINSNFYMTREDLSCGIEFKPISFVNHINYKEPHKMNYITKREIMPGVNLNLDQKFLCSCECIDDCEDKTKCSCWQLTYDFQKNFPQFYKNSDVGYQYKRLNEQMFTGIYECNDYCKCSKTCLNRVVQQPLTNKLQVFLTEKKGWGVRTLNDIPQGSFVCTYVGQLLTEKDAEKYGIESGDDYLADLDYIETMEEIKQGYESDVVLPEMQSEEDSSSSDEDIEDFNPGSNFKNKMCTNRSPMSLRKKNVQNTNTKSNGTHQLSKLNIKQNDYKSEQKSIRSYLDEDSSVYIIDAKTKGNVGRYFNHSCDPNIFFQNVFVDTHDLRFPWVAYFALTSIAAGTELTLNYGYAVGSVKEKILKCYCESKNCKGRLL